MHNNYYFLCELTKALRKKIVGWEVITCFSQIKDELIIGLSKADEEFFIRAYLQPEFTCLAFPTTFNRANKNTAELFPEIKGSHIIDIVQFENERSFALIFDDRKALVFKMFGNRSNLILFENDKNINQFKKNLVLDASLKFEGFQRVLNQDYNSFLAANGDYQKLFPTFGKIVRYHLRQDGYDAMSLHAKWEKLLETKQLLENPEAFYLTTLEGIPSLSLLKIGDVFDEFADPLAALNTFFISYTRDFYLEKEKKAGLKLLENQLKASKSYIKKTEQKRQEIIEGMGYDKIANIIMANLHAIPANTATVSLLDFYNDKTLDVKLNPKLSPQKNAEVYYRKSKNQALEVNNLEDNIAQKKARAQEIQDQMQYIEAVSTVKELRRYLQEKKIIQNEAQKNLASPFKTFEIDGFQILVGKNAKNNDLLTQKYAYKEDLWLHAKDVSGSHVVIKYQAGKNFPKSVKEKAAQLAAYYSQRKTDSLCPVIVTPKKFVRKPKGAAPGALVVDKEEVLLVVPGLSF